MFVVKKSQLKKGREEDLAPMVQKLNTGPTPQANETASQARANQLLSDLHSHFAKPWPPSGRSGFGSPSEAVQSNVQHDVHIALKHRLKNLHGIDISDPNAIRVVPQHVAESLDTDYPTLYALARSAGTPLTALRDDLASQSGVQRRSTFLREVSQLPLDEALKRVFFHGTNSTGSSLATAIGGTQFPDPQITQEIGNLRPNTFHAGFYTGTASKARQYDTGAVAAFGVSPKARIAHALGMVPERYNIPQKSIDPLVSEKKDFTDDEEKKVIAFLKEIFTKRGYSGESFDTALSHYGNIFAYGDDPQWTHNTLLGLVRYLNSSGSRDVRHIAPLAMATIGYDGVEDPRSRHSVVSIFPHGIPKIRTLAAMSRNELGDTQSFDTTRPPVGGRYPEISAHTVHRSSGEPRGDFYDTVGDELRDKLTLPQEKIIIAARRPGERGPREYRVKSLNFFSDTSLLKSIVHKDKPSYRALERAAQRIQTEIAKRKRSGKPTSLDSGHLEQLFEHLIANHGPEGLLKAGMLLRTQHEGHVTQSDIRLLNMLPFSIHGATTMAPLNSYPSSTEDGDKVFAPQHGAYHIDPHILAHIEDSIPTPSRTMAGLSKPNWQNAIQGVTRKYEANWDYWQKQEPFLKAVEAILDPAIRTMPKIKKIIPQLIDYANGEYPIRFRTMTFEYPEHFKKKADLAFGNSTEHRKLLSDDISSIHKVMVGGYLQTALKYGKKQSIMDWLAKYAPKDEDIRHLRKRYLYHGARVPHRFPDIDQIHAGHYYGHGIYASTRIHTPLFFSQVGIPASLYGISQSRGIYPFSLNSLDKIIQKITVPSNVKIFNHDKNYSKTKIPQLMMKYFDDLAEKMHRPDLKGAFEDTLRKLHTLEVGHTYNPVTQRYQRTSTLGHKMDETADYSQHPEYFSYMNGFMDPSLHTSHDGPNSIMNKLYGHYLLRAARVTFEKFGSNVHHAPLYNPHVPYDYMNRDTNHYSPYRNATFHTTNMLAALGFGGYRHCDPESLRVPIFNTNKDKIESRGERKIIPKNIRSVVLFGSAFTDIPAMQFRIAYRPSQERKIPVGEPDLGNSEVHYRTVDNPETELPQLPAWNPDTPKKLPSVRGKRGRFTAREILPSIPSVGDRPSLVLRRNSGER
jgi:hypothetical protein